MKKVEDELRHVLRRKDPPAGFAHRVLQRAGGDAPPRSLPQAARLAVVRWAAAAALIAVAAGGLHYQALRQERAERARGEVAKEQLVEALRVAGSKLQFVREKIKEVGS